MKDGLAPIGIDGKPVVLHHVLGIANDMGYYIELSATAHKVFHQTFGYKDFVENIWKLIT